MTILKLKDPMMTGGTVRTVQQLLIAAGAKIDADGEYGKATEQAVKVFQYDNHLTVDGEVGPKTMGMLQHMARHGPSVPPERPKTFGGVIAAFAKSKIGQHEKPNNSGFLDSAFEKFMRAFGWFKGAAWCAFFARAVWLTVYDGYPKTCAAIRAVLGGSTIQSWNNAVRESRKPGSPWKIGTKAQVGAIAYYRHSRTTGHAVIPIDIIGNGKFYTSEGNGDSKGGREGVEVATRVRGERDNNLLGFVYPPNPADFGDVV